jgi:hypothetical protein
MAGLPIPLVALPRDGTSAGVGALRFFYAKPKKLGTVFTRRSVFLSLSS